MPTIPDKRADVISITEIFANAKFCLNWTFCINPNAFIGINAAGKTSVLKVILLALNLLNNQPINHIETKEILPVTPENCRNTDMS